MTAIITKIKYNLYVKIAEEQAREAPTIVPEPLCSLNKTHIQEKVLIWEGIVNDSTEAHRVLVKKYQKDS